MDDSINVPTRLIVLIFCFGICCFYFNNKFSKPEFKGYVQKVFKPILGNETNHTLLNMLENNSGILSVGLSTSAVTIVSYLPKFIVEPKNVIYGLVATGALGLAKYKFDVIDWGFYQLKKNETENIKN
ncbi:unnamed protein product [Brachionus calyciflorus]|uniref:Uncharacterized protein n=1 Tax=Brachionus calyciflorus TaxID=104777 RepID=A0A813Z904_9BILA|nr:unnamed protein product [Brachionus calyciflorus]